MNLFQDLQEKGTIYSALNEYSLICKPFEEDVVKELIDQMWYPDIDYDQDQSEYDQLSALPIFLIHIDEYKTEVVQSLLEAYKPLNEIKESGHFFDFLLIDCRNNSVSGFGLGRKNRPFAAFSENGSEFDYNNPELAEHFSNAMPADLFGKINELLTDLGQEFANIDNTPGNEEMLQELLDDGPTDDGYYFFEDEDLELSEEEIQNHIWNLGVWAENIDDTQDELRILFPNLEIYELNTGDY